MNTENQKLKFLKCVSLLLTVVCLAILIVGLIQQTDISELAAWVVFLVIGLLGLLASIKPSSSSKAAEPEAADEDEDAWHSAMVEPKKQDAVCEKENNKEKDCADITPAVSRVDRKAEEYEAARQEFYQANSDRLTSEAFTSFLDKMEEHLGSPRSSWSGSKELIKGHHSEAAPGYHTETYCEETFATLSAFDGDASKLEWREGGDVPCKASAILLIDDDGEKGIYPSRSHEIFHHSITVYDSPYGAKGYWCLELFEESYVSD